MVVASRSHMSAGGKRARPPEEKEAEEKEGEEEGLTPLQREILHVEQEAAGKLTFPIYTNDGSHESLTALIRLKCIFCEQLPRMPKEYITRLVLNRTHVSLACSYEGTIVGGITYRPVEEQRLSEIVFCAVSAKHQVQGYGTRIMNQIKEECKRQGIEGMLTYADNHAVGYFRKQGFKKNIKLKRERWQGYLKDYEGATLMECLVDPTIDYLSTRQLANKQRDAIVAKIAQMESEASGSDGTAASQAAKEVANKELLKNGWGAPTLDIRVGGVQIPTSQYLTEFVEAVCAHEDAWPFRQAVSVADAPDYYTVITQPIDLSLVRERLEAGNYYASPEMLTADLYVMCENCQVYNDPSTSYYECASRLEAFVRSRFAEAKVKRLPAAAKTEAAAQAAP